MVMGLVLSLLLIAFGAIFQLTLFLHNSFGILFFLFFLFQLAMASFAFLCSIFVRKVCSPLLHLNVFAFSALSTVYGKIPAEHGGCKHDAITVLCTSGLCVPRHGIQL